MVVLTMLCRKGADPSKSFSKSFPGLLAGTLFNRYNRHHVSGRRRVIPLVPVVKFFSLVRLIASVITSSIRTGRS